MHVDDREQAVARAINLGGSVVENHTAGEFSWTVMADPEGNEFCIAPSH
jgi:predicted enzyme related to lactoylglutathione lyase